MAIQDFWSAFIYQWPCVLCPVFTLQLQTFRLYLNHIKLFIGCVLFMAYLKNLLVNLKYYYFTVTYCYIICKLCFIVLFFYDFLYYWHSIVPNNLLQMYNSGARFIMNLLFPVTCDLVLSLIESIWYQRVATIAHVPTEIR